MAALGNGTTAAIAATAVVVILTAIAVYALRANAAFDGPYRVLNSLTEWDLSGDKGEVAVITKRQNVRFNFSTHVVRDTAYDDTERDPFEEYEAKHGKLLGTSRYGSETVATIALRAEQRRGQEACLESTRTVRGAFPNPTNEYIELVQSQRGPSRFIVFFPPDSSPRNATFMRSKNKRAKAVDLVEESGRRVFRMEPTRLEDNETVRLSWDWE